MFFPNAAFRDRVLKAAEEMIQRHLGADGDNGMAAFIGVLKGDLESGNVSLTEMAKSWRAAKLSHREAALALIDGIVSRMKSVAESKPDAATGMQHFASYLERVIDAEFDAHPGRIAPINGRVGASLSKHMGAFMKPL